MVRRNGSFISGNARLSKYGLGDSIRIGITHAASGYAFCRSKAPRIAVVFRNFPMGMSKALGQRDDGKTAHRAMIYLTPVGVPHGYHALKARKWHLCWVAYEEDQGSKSYSGRAKLNCSGDAAHGLRDAILGLYRMKRMP